MSGLDAACREVVDRVDGAVACGVVDLNTGRLLGIHSPYPTAALKEALAAATVDLFRGASGGKIERKFRKERATDIGMERATQEVHVMSRDYYHFAKLLKGGKAAVMLVTSRTTNVGMGSAQMKAVIPMMEPHLK